MGLISNGTTVFDNGAMASGFVGNLVFISSATASASANISFTSGIDSTYKEYVFYFVNMHPATNDVQFEFNLSTDGGSNYNVTKTTTYFNAYHNESDTAYNLGYDGSYDIAQGTGFQTLSLGQGNDTDESTSGTLQLFNPSSTTYVKHFISNTNNYQHNNYTINNYSAGYGNTTSAINAIRFQMSSGNIDAGTIYMFGVN